MGRFDKWREGHGWGEATRTGGFYCFSCGKSINKRDKHAVKTHGGLKKCRRKLR